MAARWTSIGWCIGVFTFLSISVTVGAGAQQPPAEWVSGQVLISGASVTVDPAYQAVPLNTGTVVNTHYGSGQGTPPEGYTILGELTGPAYNSPQELVCVPNQPLQIPPLPVAGTYYIQNIRLMDGATQLALAQPSQVQIDATNVVISQVTSRPMTDEEIQESGIVLNASDYKAYRFTVGLGLTSGNVNLDFPVLFSATDPTRPPIVLSKLQVPGPPPLPNVLPSGPGNLPDELGNIDLEPIVLKPENLDFDLDIPGLNLSGLLVFPNRITFLNQFFVVAILLQNGAPQGSVLKLDQMTATIQFPNGSQFVLKSTNPPMAGGAVPVMNPGPDGQLGTGDDIPVLTAGMQGQGEFDVTTPLAGTYTVTIDFHGTLSGLPTGTPIPVSGHASGVVVVRDPTFHVTFAHPSVVRQNEQYTLKVTVSNTSTVDANDVSLALPSSQISGAALLSGQPSTISLGTLHAGDSATASFQLVAFKTGEVTTTSVSGTGGTSGTIQLFTGVGDAGIPLSPDTLVLPDVVNEQIPADLVNASLDFLGLGWSLATAPPSERPANLVPVSEGQVRLRAAELSEIAHFLKVNQSPQYSVASAVSELALRWLGNETADQGFDGLRRLPDDTSGPSKGEVLAQVIGGHLVTAGQKVLAAHSAFAQATRYMNPNFSAALDPTAAAVAPKFWLEGGQGRRLGDSETSGVVRDVPWGESYPFGAGRLLAVGKLAGDESFTLHIEGQGDGTVDLSVFAPLTGGPTLVTFQGIEVHAGSQAKVVFQPNSSSLVLQNDPTGTGTFTTVAPSSSSPVVLQPPVALGAIQDLLADQTGRAVSVLFSRPVDKTSAETLANYAMDTRQLVGVYLQPDGRVVVLRALSAVSPLVSNTVTVQGVEGEGDLTPMPASQTLPVVTFLTGPSGTVHGTVYGDDGLPLANAEVNLWENDPDTISGVLVEHRTAQTTTDGNGQFFLDYVRARGTPFSVEATDPTNGHMAKVTAMVTFDRQDLVLSLFMRARGSVRGQVLMPNGTPAVGATVQATELTTGESGQAQTDYNGLYEIDKLPVGTISIEAVGGQGFASGTCRIGHAGDVATVNLTLGTLPVGSVQGIVHLSSSDPASGYVAGLSGPVTTSLFCGLDGSFLAGGLVPGAYTLTIYEPVTFIKRYSQQVTVVGGQTTDAGVIVLPDQPEGGTGTITGHVYLPNGSAVAGATVYATSGTSGEIGPVVTDSSGTYTLPSVPLGNWFVTGYDPTTRRVATSQTSIAFNGQSVGADLYLSALGTITGTVYQYDSNGNPVHANTGVTVLLGDQSTLTDANGQYVFTNVPAGGYGLIAGIGLGGDDPPLDLGKGSAQITFDGQSVTANIQMYGRGDVRVHVLIKGENGQPDQPVAALVNMFKAKFNSDYSLGTEVESQYSDATTGEALFSHLIGAGFHVTATNGLNGAGSLGGRVRAGVTTDVTVYLQPTGEVMGMVYEPDGLTPVPYALVTLQIQGLPDRSIAADATGHYDFDLVSQGYVKVVVQDTATGKQGYAQGLLSSSTVPLNLDVRLLGTGRVVGIATELDAQGQVIPAVNARVTLNGSAPLSDHQITTDLLGQFSFDDIEEGTYGVQVVDPYHPFPLAGRSSVTVVKDQTAQVNVALSSYGTVTGTLTMPDGSTPVSGVQVVLSTQADSTQVMGFSVTDSSGAFSFTYVPVQQPFRLDALDVRTGRSATGSGELSTPNQVATVNLVLAAIGTIQGTVWNHAQSQTIANPQVSTVIPGVSGMISTTGDAQGQYAFPGLPQGTYNVSAVDPTNGARASGQGAITTEGQDFVLDLIMPAFRSVTGTVTRSDGATPVPGAVVTLDRSHQQAADANGAFSFTGVTLGSYDVMAADPLSLDGGKVHIGVTTDGEVVQAPVRFVGLGTVQGAVKDASGNPVEGFSVRLSDQNDYSGTDSAGPIGTPADGSYEFQSQHVGHITVTAVAPVGSGDTRRGTAQGDLSSDGGTLALDIALSASGSVSGKVVDGQGAAVSGAQVQLTFTSPPSTWYAGTDTAGSFRFPVLPMGTFTVFITAPTGGHARSGGTLSSDGQNLDLGAITLNTAVPVVTSEAPADGAVGVAVNVAPTAIFNEAIDPASVTHSTVKLTNADSGQEVSSTLAVSADGLTVTLTPDQPLASLTHYSFTVGPGVLDLSGNAMASAVTVHFQTLDNVPPSVTTTFPADGAVQVPAGTYPFVQFSEDIDTNSVAQGIYTISSDGTSVQGTVSQPESNNILFSPTAGLALNAIYTVSVSGFKDLSGNVMLPFTSTFTTQDTIPPAVAASVSASAVLPGGVVTISATASDNLGLDRVEFYADSVLIGTSHAAPFQVTYTAPNQPGTVQIMATAYDKAGNTASDSKTLTVNADTSAPVVTVSSPQAGAEFMNGSTITMQATATDDVGVVSVEFRLEDTAGSLIWNQMVTSPPYQASYPVSGLTANVDRNVVVKASDQAGNVGQGGPVLIHLVYNHDPVVTVTSPSAGGSAIAGGRLHLEVTASDPDGPLSEVDFFINGSLVHAFNTPPVAPPFAFDYAVTDPVGTTLAFTARAVGDKGDTTTSDPVTVTVVNDPGTTVVGTVVDAQGTGVSGATVSIDGYTPSATTSAGGTFSLDGVPTTNGSLTLRATYIQSGVTYTTSKSGVVPVVAGTTQVGTLTLFNLNDTSAVDGTLPLDASGSAFRVSRRGANFAVVATTATTASHNHVYVVDVSNPSLPVKLSEWTDTSTIHDVKVWGNYVYVADDGLTILQVEANGSLTQVGQVAAGAFPCCLNSGYPNVLAVNGQMVYLGMAHYVVSIDVSVPSAPQFVGGWTETQEGTLLDLAVWRNELIGITDASSQGWGSNSLVVGVLDSSGIPGWNSGNYVDVGATAGDSARALNRLFVDGNTLYISRGASGVVAFDLSQTVKPVYLGKVALPGLSQGMWHGGTTLYAALGAGYGMGVIDTTALGSMRLIVANAVNGTPHDVVVSGAYAYLATGGGVWAVNLVNAP